MRIVIQRVKSAKVVIDSKVSGSIGHGLLLLAGIGRGDSARDAEYLVNKITYLRIFEDDNGKMNRDIREAGGAILIVSNFTVYGDTRNGRRPGFERAAPPLEAKPMFEELVRRFRETGIPVETGVFQADMLVQLENDGPVTLICESREKEKGPA
jgi:D-aminoacyl-tRNA deacylase